MDRMPATKRKKNAVKDIRPFGHDERVDSMKSLAPLIYEETYYFQYIHRDEMPKPWTQDVRIPSSMCKRLGSPRLSIFHAVALDLRSNFLSAKLRLRRYSMAFPVPMHSENSYSDG